MATRLPLANLADCDLRLSANEALIGTVRLTGFGATGTIKDGAVAVNIGQAQGVRILDLTSVVHQGLDMLGRGGCQVIEQLEGHRP